MSRLQIRLQTHLMLAILSIFFAIGATQAHAEQQLLKKFFPGHYIYAGAGTGSGLPPLGSNEDKMKRQRILGNDSWVGYFVGYNWSDLEPSFGVYDFTKLRADLETAKKDGKVMSVMLYERSWADGAPFPGPNYMNPASPDYRTAYADMYFSPASDPGRQKPNLWKPLFGDRMIPLINAIGAEFDSHPSLASVSFPETANVGMKDQPGYTGAQYLTYLKRLHTAAAAAFPTTIVHQTTNWGSGMSTAQIEELAVHLVEVCKASIGATDLMGGNNALENSFGKYFLRYRDIAVLYHRAESDTYSNGASAQEQFEYSIDAIGNNMQGWSAWRGAGGTPAITIDDVMPVVDAEKGRVNPRIPSNLIKSTPVAAIPAPGGLTLSLE